VTVGEGLGPKLGETISFAPESQDPISFGVKLKASARVVALLRFHGPARPLADYDGV
jgi:hypothetical protein